MSEIGGETTGSKPTIESNSEPEDNGYNPPVTGKNPDQNQVSNPKVEDIQAQKLSIVRRLLNMTSETFAIRDKQMPPEEIQDSTTAYLIQRYLKNSISGSLPGEIPFTIRDVLADAGYTGMLRSTDLMKKYPKQYQLFRQSLNSLVRNDILVSQEMEERTADNESVIYFIPRDERELERREKLEQLAIQAELVSPTYRIPKQ